MRQLGRSARTRLLIGTSVVAILCSGGAALAQDKPAITIAPQPLASALYEFGGKTGTQVIFPSSLANAKRSGGVAGESDERLAMAQLLAGTGLTFQREGDTFVIVSASDPQSGSAAGDGADQGTVQALIVTAQKREENIQDVPIAMSAFSQEDLTRSQVATGADLMTQVPNMTFTKTNFSSYSIQIRGIGTQAISATTDAAVAVAFNNTPFIRNRFFEQEFYDLQRVEVLRGPQGTLYGRNATAGVVNIISQKPKFTYEAKASLDVSNYSSHRLEAMLNIPLVEDKVALRIAGAWTKRDGFVDNETKGQPIDGRDLWSTRLSLRVTPTDWLDANLIWEHFQENDDRLRSGKQLCHQDDRETLGGLLVDAPGANGVPASDSAYSNIYSQGCLPASLYSPDSYEAPNGYSLPYYLPLGYLGIPVIAGFNPYASLVQSHDLRVIESTVDPKYRAKSDLVELQWSADLGKNLTLASETSYNYDTIFSLEDFNRFTAARGAFKEIGWIAERHDVMQPGEFGYIFCDPQVGCADSLVAVDVSRAKSSQFSQEFRLSSNYEGAFNFSLGANFLRYDTLEKYYVFINTLSMVGALGGRDNSPSLGDPTALYPWDPRTTTNLECFGFGAVAPDPTTFQMLAGCQYMDPNPIESVNDLGHNYFLSKNPYKLISYAVFGEAYYNIAENLKVTAGLRWTVDKKESPRIPSMLLAAGGVGHPVLAVEEQEWREPTGRLAIDWKPDLSFTDETLLYGSYSHGYKAGGANPPPSGVVTWTPNLGPGKVAETVAKPKTFDPEFVNAFEVGAKNTLLEGRMTLNLAGFYYDYKGYQVSQIIDRSAVNYNFDAKVWGLELEADWRALENLRFGFKGGYENTRIGDGQQAIDIMERNYGHGPDSADPWVVIRPFPTYPSNCVLPLSVFDQGPVGGLLEGRTNLRYPMFTSGNEGPCEIAYSLNLDPVTFLPYVPNPTLTDTGFGIVPLATADGSQQYLNYPGFDPNHDYGNNHGEGFFKPLGGHELPNAPHFTATVTADYTIPLPNDWLATLHTDLYYQSEAWTRVFNMPGYDKLKAFTNVNVAAIFTNDAAGWKVMAYIKNVFDKDNITGAFLNSDDTGLTTNVFLVEPRLYGLRVTKDFTGGPWWTGANPHHTGPYPLTVELSGTVIRQDAPYSPILPPVAQLFSGNITPANLQNRNLDWGDGREIRLTYRPGGVWSVSGSYRYARSNSDAPLVHKEEAAAHPGCLVPSAFYPEACTPGSKYLSPGKNWSDSTARESEKHEVADFAVGRDVGLGLVGDSHSRVGAGLRYAQFKSATQAGMRGVPDWDMADGWIFYPSPYHRIDALLTAEREFKGAGPTLSWEAAQRLFGSEAAGHLDVDWSVTGGVLFGKQKAHVSGRYQSEFFENTKYHGRGWRLPQMPDVPLDVAPRNKSVTVPVVDLSLGLAYEVQRIKVGVGYKWERYFNVLDTGYAEHKDADRIIDGPYFKVAVGFGG